tara:strand:+ start:1244 stop:1453 length:210 start_codon:yes stop_codon:yes gene_type:complete
MKNKAGYYQWLMDQHRATEEKINLIPKLSLEEQSKSAMIKEYNDVNQKKVNDLKAFLLKIENEALKIQR